MQQIISLYVFVVCFDTDCCFFFKNKNKNIGVYATLPTHNIFYACHICIITLFIIFISLNDLITIIVNYFISRFLMQALINGS